MLSRVASSIYWMSRLIERAESTARLLDVNQRMILDLPADVKGQWNPIVETTGGMTEFSKHYSEHSRENVIAFMAYDERNSSSIVSCLAAARENARTIREIISSEMWLYLNQLYWEMKSGLGSGAFLGNQIHGLLSIAKNGSQFYSGIMDSTMSHTDAWLFGILGRYLERADQTARILDIKYYHLLPSVTMVNSPLDLLQWSTLLMSASAYEMYLKQYGKVNFEDLVTFLTFDKKFPRSILFCLQRAEECLHEITGTQIGSFSNSAEKEWGKIRSQMEFMDVNDVISMGLHEFIDWFQIRHRSITEAIYNSFFEVKQLAASD